jgi:hypothetical protein
MRKEKDPDPGGPKTSGSPTLVLLHSRMRIFFIYLAGIVPYSVFMIRTAYWCCGSESGSDSDLIGSLLPTSIDGFCFLTVFLLYFLFMIPTGLDFQGVKGLHETKKSRLFSLETRRLLL